MEGFVHELDAIEVSLMNIRRECYERCYCDPVYLRMRKRDPQCAYHNWGQYIVEQVDKGLSALAALRAARQAYEGAKVPMKIRDM